MNREDVDTLIVGAGPIGLLNAIGLLQQNPDRKVQILEKRNDYTRKHMVRFSHAKLTEYIKAIGGEPIAELVELEKRLQKNSAIRIKELEEILRALAEQMGADIKHEEFSDAQKQLENYPKLELLMGCDGTHSTVSEQIFDKDNQIKQSFDYVLQVRFEVTGQGVNKVDLPSWPAYLQAYGVVGEELIAKTVEGKTPITMQIMIPKEDFDLLIPYAPAKTPIRPFNDEETELKYVPAGIMQKIKGYLGFRLAHYTKHNIGEHINMSQIEFSVNEAPATRAKSVVNHIDINGREICVILSGDAALGLSYFKGFNAGLENTAKIHYALRSELEQRKEKLEAYEAWFDQDLAPRKIKEVADYSEYIARRIEKITTFLNKLLGRDFILDATQAERYTDLYNLNQREARKNNTNLPRLDSPYMHRKSYFYAVLNSTPVPLYQYGKKISGYFKKYFTSYKSNYHMYRDLLQPFNAIRHLLVGATKIVFSPLFFIAFIPVNFSGFLFTVFANLSTMAEFKMYEREIEANFATAVARMIDGLAEIGFGTLLAATSILVPIKVIANYILTQKHEPRKIENNPGMVRLVEEAEKITAVDGFSTNRMHVLLLDVHRKFEKSLSREQNTQISKDQEIQLYNACNLQDSDSYKSYFKLFKANDSQSQTPQSSYEEIAKKQKGTSVC